MPSRIFLSHDSRDKAIAKVISETLSRITLQGLRVWFSSDASPSGGIQPGSVWLDEIRRQLSESRAIIVLLTPTSIERPWLLFESGYGAATADNEVIPVCVGIDSLSDIPFPLAMYQCYQLVDYESLKDFAARILNRYEIPFDEELCKPVLRTSIADITNAMPENIDSETARELTTRELVAEVEMHIDRRFIDLNERLAHLLTSDNDKPSGLSYSIAIKLNFKGTRRKNYLKIYHETTVQDVLDNVYYMLEAKVETFTYLTSWIMRNPNTKKNLIIREVSDMIPAHHVFKQNSVWEVVPLDQPYAPSKFSDAERWYNTDEDA